MQTTDVNFDGPVFTTHPPGWQSPSDVVAGFTVAWALELRERARISPYNPFADWVRDRLPAEYRFDTLGKLIQLPPGSSGNAFGANPLVRLTTLCGAWQLFDLMNQRWQIRPHDFGQFADLQAFVTGGTERRSLYRDLSANLSKCLLAVRVRRALQATDELDLSEQWFFTGDPDLTFCDPRGNDCLLFHFTGITQVPLALFAHDFVETVWATARVTVEQLGVERTLTIYADRVDTVSDLLVRGGERALRAQRVLRPLEFRFYNNWPGWD